MCYPQSIGLREHLKGHSFAGSDWEAGKINDVS